mmetsp:Transcript_6705/g.6024  ORF Transcript_6705/g.6024 Transcript_6705/m.6024 type:complete len:86 (+) Transcript_6705:1900-2157(+)
MCKVFNEHITALFDKMQTNLKKLSRKFFDVMANITENGGALPNGYFTEFEIKRVQFDKKGYLRDMYPINSKIILGGVVLLRALIH